MYPKQLLTPIWEYLKKLERELLRRKKDLDAEDPFADTSRLNDNASEDTEASEQWGHERTQALGAETERALARVQKAMARVQEGVYGQCTRCQQMIDTDRLGIDPTAEYCLKCAQELGG